MRLQARVRTAADPTIGDRLREEKYSVRTISGGAAIIVDLKRSSAVVLAPNVTAEVYRIPWSSSFYDLRIEVDESLEKARATVVCNDNGSKLTPVEESISVEKGRATFRLTKPFVVVEADDSGATLQRVSFSLEGDIIIVIRRVIPPGLASPGALMEPMVAAVTKWTERHTKRGLYFVNVSSSAAPKPPVQQTPPQVTKATPTPSPKASAMKDTLRSTKGHRASAPAPEPTPPAETPSDEPMADDGVSTTPVN